MPVMMFGKTAVHAEHAEDDHDRGNAERQQADGVDDRPPTGKPQVDEDDGGNEEHERDPHRAGGHLDRGDQARRQSRLRHRLGVGGEREASLVARLQAELEGCGHGGEDVEADQPEHDPAESASPLHRNHREVLRWTST